MRVQFLSWPGVVGVLAWLFAGTEASAQKLMSGYVVTVAGDTIRGAILLQNELIQQYQVEFIALQGHRVLVMDAYELASYTYYTKTDTVYYAGLSFYQDDPPIAVRGFLRQLVDGKVQLYHYCYRRLRPRYLAYPSSTPPGNSKYPLFGPLSRKGADFAAKGAEYGVPRFPHCLVVYQDDHPKLQEVSWWNLRKDAASYFADCPELATDLQAGRYRSRDMVRIVRRYNTWHKAQQQTR